MNQVAGILLGQIGHPLVGDIGLGESDDAPPDPQQALPDLARAQAGVDQQPGVVRLEVGAIATGTAGQYRKLDGHGRDGRRRGRGRQFRKLGIELEKARGVPI